MLNLMRSLRIVFSLQCVMVCLWADEGAFYAGAGGGRLFVDGVRGEYYGPKEYPNNYFMGGLPPPAGAAQWVTKVSGHKSVSAMSVFSGYRFPKYFALEARYTDFGALDLNIEYSPYLSHYFFEPGGPAYFPTRQHIEMKALSLALLTRTPEWHGLSAELGVGVEQMQIRQEEICGLVKIFEPRRFVSPLEKREQMLLSIGATYRIYQGLSARAVWTRHHYRYESTGLFYQRPVRMNQYQLEFLWAF